MKCINCGKFPFCNKIEDSQQEACENFIKRKIEEKITYTAKIEMNLNSEETENEKEVDVTDFFKIMLQHINEEIKIILKTGNTKEIEKEINEKDGIILLMEIMSFDFLVDKINSKEIKIIAKKK